MATKAGESPEDLAGSCHLPLQPSSHLSWMEHRNELREGGRLPKKGWETDQHPKRKPLNFRAWSCCVGAGAGAALCGVLLAFGYPSSVSRSSSWDALGNSPTSPSCWRVLTSWLPCG